MDINVKIDPEENNAKKAVMEEDTLEKRIKEKCSVLNQGVEKNDTKANNCFQCKICPYNTFRKPFLEKHMIQKHGFFKVNVDKKHESISDNEPMDIGIIKNDAKMEDRVQSESSKSIEDMEYKCKQCNFETRYLNLLNIHQEVHTGKEEVYQCIQCKFKTKEITALRDHENTHKKLTLFSCSNCDYATRQKCNLRAHMRVHEDPKKLERFSCMTCKKFVSFHYSALLRHVKLKHGTDGVTLQCDKCPFTTKIQKRLLNHKKLHVNHNDMPMFKCEKCDFITYNEQTIQRHVQRHEARQKDGEEVILKEQMDEKEIVWFCCNICDFRSKDQRYVILHKKVHVRVDEINKAGESIVQAIEIKTDSAESSSESS